MRRRIALKNSAS